MNAITMPGFTAHNSISQRRSFRSTGDRNNHDKPAVVPQLRNNGGFGSSGGRLGWSWPSRCEIDCAIAASICIAATDGLGVAACIAAELTCLEGCNQVALLA